MVFRADEGGDTEEFIIYILKAQIAYWFIIQSNIVKSQRCDYVIYKAEILSLTMSLTEPWP